MIEDSPAVERLGNPEIEGGGADSAAGERQSHQSFRDTGLGGGVGRIG